METVYSVISPSQHNPKREVVRWQFRTREEAEEFVKAIKIVEVERYTEEEKAVGETIRNSVRV